MTKVLYVGDVHATVDTLEECRRLIAFIRQLTIDNRVDYIHFLGDQYHNHALIHVEVMAFWRKAFRDLSITTIAQVGNHDKPGTRDDGPNSMSIHEGGNVSIVEAPTLIRDGIAVLPHYTNPETFYKQASLLAHAGCLVAHQTFVGSKYENGIYAHDGLDPNLCPQLKIISGHIHTQQEFGKVWYPGSPRWMNLGDANQTRGVWLVDHGLSGSWAGRQFYSTADICTPIWALVDSEEEPLDEKDVPTYGKVYVDIKGSESYCQDRKAKWSRPSVKVRSFPTSQKIEVRESEGVSVAFNKFVKAYRPKNGTNSELLMKMASERVSWLK